MVALTLEVYSQKDTTEHRLPLKHALGVQFGTTTGFGFSYRYMPNKWGVQVVGVAGTIMEDFVSSVGFSALYRFHQAERIDVFGFVGNHFLTYRSYGYSDRLWNAGLGAGINYKFSEVFSVNYQLGYAIFNLSTNNNFSNGPISAVAAEVGIHYNF